MAATSTSASAPLESPSPPIRPSRTSGCRLQERDGAVGVLLPAPGVGVRIALALAAPAGVIEQDAVAVAGEHRGVRHRAAAVAAAAVGDDDRRAVGGRPVPAGELQAVGGAERDVLVGRARRRAHVLAPLVHLDDRHAGRDQHERQGDERRRHGDGARAPVRRAAVPPRNPQRRARRAPVRRRRRGRRSRRCPSCRGWRRGSRAARRWWRRAHRTRRRPRPAGRPACARRA